MTQLPLDEQHRALGATMVTENGWEVVRHYGDPRAEHQAVRQRAGVADLSDRGLWRVTGQDRAKYLQGILTNDILALQPGTGCYAALLDVKGRLQADLHIYAQEEQLLIDLDPAQTETVVSLLKRYIVVYKVKLEDASADLLHFLMTGPKTAEWLQGLFGQSLPSLPDHHHTTWSWRDSPIHCIHRSQTGEEGVHLLVPRAIGGPFWEALLEQGHSFGSRPIGTEALESLRIEAGIAKFGTELDGTRFPAEAAIEHAISYTKGCYLGQETTMRIHTQGSVNKKLVGLLLDAPELPKPGTSLIADGQEIGRLTSVLMSPTMGKMIALGYLRKGCWSEGTTATIQSGGSATVTPLPFYQAATSPVASR